MKEIISNETKVMEIKNDMAKNEKYKEVFLFSINNNNIIQKNNTNN